MKKISFKKNIFLTLLFLFLPGLSLAFDFPKRIGAIDDWMGFFQNLADNIIGFLWLLFGSFAFASFIYAGYLFLNARGDMSKVKDARQALIWGVVGVMVGSLLFVIPFIVKGLLGF